MTDDLRPYRISIRSSKGLDVQRIVFVPPEDGDERTNPNAIDELERWLRSDYPHVESASMSVEPLDPNCGEVLAALMDRLESALRRFESEVEWILSTLDAHNVGPLQAAAAALIRGPQLRPPLGVHDDPNSLRSLFHRVGELDRAAIDASRGEGWKVGDPIRRVEVAVRRTPDGYAAHLALGTQHHVDLGDNCSTSRFEWDGEDDTWIGAFRTHELAVRAISRDVSDRTDLPECGRWTLEVEGGDPR